VRLYRNNSVIHQFDFSLVGWLRHGHRVASAEVVEIFVFLYCFPILLHPNPLKLCFGCFCFGWPANDHFFFKKRTAEMTRKQEDPSLYTWSRIERVTIMDGHRNATARPPRLWHPTHIRHNKSIYDIYDASSSYKVVHLFIFSQNRTAQQGRPIRMWCSGHYSIVSYSCNNKRNIWGKMWIYKTIDHIILAWS
jgi:hypothetical protein